jgi:hypothetical protein
MYGNVYSGFALYEGWDLYQDPLATVDSFGGPIERIPNSTKGSVKDARYVYWEDSGLTGPHTTYANTEVMGFMALHEFNRNYVELSWEEGFTMSPKPSEWGFFTEAFTVTFDMTQRIEFTASGEIIHYTWDEVKAEIAASAAFANITVTDAIAGAAILTGLGGTGDPSNCTLTYPDFENYALVYDVVKSFHQGSEVEHFSQNTWAINYYSTPGDYNSKFSTVVCGVIENNKYVVKTITSDAIWGSLRNTWTPVNGFNGNYIAYAMSGTPLNPPAEYSDPLLIPDYGELLGGPNPAGGSRHLDARIYTVATDEYAANHHNGVGNTVANISTITVVVNEVATEYGVDNATWYPNNLLWIDVTESLVHPDGEGGRFNTTSEFVVYHTH